MFAWKIGVPQQSLDENKYLREQVHFCVLELNFRNGVINFKKGSML
jgi:hypothetical protein